MASKLLPNEMWKGGSGGPLGFYRDPWGANGVGGGVPGWAEGPGVNSAAGLREDDKRLKCEMFAPPRVKSDLWSVLSPSLQLESTKTIGGMF